MLCYIMCTKDAVFTLALEHDLEIEGLNEFFIIPKDIKDMIVGKWWLDIGLLQVWCT